MFVFSNSDGNPNYFRVLKSGGQDHTLATPSLESRGVAVTLAHRKSVPMFHDLITN